MGIQAFSCACFLWADSRVRLGDSGLGIVDQQLAYQCRVAWVGCVRDAAMNPNVVATAKGRGVGELIGLAAMLKGRDVVDFEDARLTAFLATPTVTI